MKKIVITILIFTNNCFAQILKVHENINSPIATSLGRYGDVPVSLNNGTTNISIPIYTMTEKGVNLDISLLYDSSGVRVGSVPSWVGQNWSLNAGGVITRQINSFADETKVESSYPSSYFYSGYFYPISHNRLNVGISWDNTANDEFLHELSSSNIGYGKNVDKISKDSEPDIFTFNFMGHSGKFFMGEDGQWKVASKNNFKIVISESDFIYPFGFTKDAFGYNLPKAIGKITLIDDQGISFTFGGVDSSIEFSKNFFDQTRNLTFNPTPELGLKWRANAWYLTEVKNSTGTILYTLDYERELGYTGVFFNYQFDKQTTRIHENGALNTLCYEGLLGGYYSSTFALYRTTSGPEPNKSTPAIGGSIISPVYLTKITPYSGEYLAFKSTYSKSTFYESSNIHTVSDYIDKFFDFSGKDSFYRINFFEDLKPYNNERELVKKLKYRELTSVEGFLNVKFVYNAPITEGQHEYRLNLNNVTIGDKVYQFEYDRFEELPRLMSRTVDHLGFHNNGYEYDSIDFSNYFNYRKPDQEKAKIGSLKKITYPTKGFSLFEYESHKYSRYVSDDKKSLVSDNADIGGLRIKKITTSDENNIEIVKEYKYVKNYNIDHNSTQSSGILSSLPKYEWRDLILRNPPANNPGKLNLYDFSIDPILPMTNFFGSPIEYSEVVEINNDGGYTIYNYSSSEDYKDDFILNSFNLNSTPYQKYNDKSLLRGKLEELKVFNNDDIIVNKQTFEYSFDDRKYIRGSSVRNFLSPCPDDDYLIGNAYKIYYFDNNLMREQNISYLNGQQIKTENNYIYQYYPDLIKSNGDSFLRSKTIQTYLDQGQLGYESVQESYSYPFDLSSPINDALVLKRILPVLQKVTTKNGVTIATDKIEYANFNSLPRPQKSLRSKGANPMEENVIIDEYDSSGNIIKYHTKDGIYTTMSWCYNKKYPIIKIIGEQILDMSFITTKTNEIQNLINTSVPPHDSVIQEIIAKLNQIRSNYPNHQVATYTYYSGYGNVTSMTDPKGYTMYYIYDAFGRLQFVKDKDGNILSENEYHYKN